MAFFRARSFHIGPTGRCARSDAKPVCSSSGVGLRQLGELFSMVCSLLLHFENSLTMCRNMHSEKAHLHTMAASTAKPVPRLSFRRGHGEA